MDAQTFFICVGLSRESHPSAHGHVSKTLFVPASMWMIEGAWDDVLDFINGIKLLDSKRVDSRFIVVPRIESELLEGSRNFIALHPAAGECGFLQLSVPDDVELSEEVLRGFLSKDAPLSIQRMGMAEGGEILGAKAVAGFALFAFESARALMDKNELSREVGVPCEDTKTPGMRL